MKMFVPKTIDTQPETATNTKKKKILSTKIEDLKTKQNYRIFLQNNFNKSIENQSQNLYKTFFFVIFKYLEYMEIFIYIYFVLLNAFL